MNRETTCCFTGHRPEKLPLAGGLGGSPVPEAEGQAGRGGGAAYKKGMRHFVRYGPGSGFLRCEAALARGSGAPA